MKTKNKLIQHLLNFGEEIKLNAKMNIKEENQNIYIMESGDYDYCFKVIDVKPYPMYSLVVILNIDRSKETFIPTMAIHFSQDGIMASQGAIELAKEGLKMGFQATEERYYGEL